MTSPILEIAQGTPEWLQIRAGKVTASRMADVLAKIKTGEAAARRNYRAQIVAEILTGKPCENGYVSADMQRGTELEPFARAAYEVKTGAMVEQVGFIQHPTIDRAGCSPDGLVGDDGLIEIKCPKVATHLEYLLANKTPSEYDAQILWQLACTGRTWVDFVSFCPDLPEHLQLFIVRTECAPDVLEGLEREVNKFLGEVDEVIEKLGKVRQ